MLKKKIGFLEAFSIGVGGMIGGGIFAVLGLTIILAKGAAPIAFFVAGVIALLTAYSYAKLSVRFPSEGGTIEFIVRAFGNGVIPGWLNSLLLASYVIMLSLYSYAFGSYGSVLFFGHETPILRKLLTAGVIIGFTLINLLGAYIVGKVEDFMVIFKVMILLGFSTLGLITADFSRVSPQNYPHVLKILTGGLIIFLAYEGFELIANAAKAVKDPEKTLPRAFYAAVLFVIFIYVLVSLVAVCNLTPEQVVKAKDYALAEAAKPFLGHLGFVLISIAALMSTASAINATLFGTARISYLVAKYGELPKVFGKKFWHDAYEGLVIISLLTVVAAVALNLENISVAGSLGFLLIFSAVNLANYRLSEETGANRFISLLGFLGCVFSAVVLVGYNLKTSPESLKAAAIVIAASFLFEVLYRLFTGRELKEFIDASLAERELFRKRFYQEFLPKIEDAVKVAFKDAKLSVEKTASVLKVIVRVKNHLPEHVANQKAVEIKKKAGIKKEAPVWVEVKPENHDGKTQA